MRDPAAPGRVLVLGAGAVGGAIGGLLHAAGAPVCLVARGEHGAAIRRGGLVLRLPDRRLTLPVPSVARIADLDVGPGDVALLATKLQDAEAALGELLARAGRGIPVVCAVNGIDGEGWAAARFDAVAAMVVWIFATHLVPGEVAIHSAPSAGVLDVGRTPEGIEPWIEALCGRLRAAGFDALARPDILRWKRAKWLINLGGAAQALVTDGWPRVALAARAEGAAVLDAAGLERVSQGELLARMRAIEERPIDGRMRPGGSTWQSRARGKPLESAWIEGAMAALGRRVGVATPALDALTAAAATSRPLTAAEALGPGDA